MLVHLFVRRYNNNNWCLVGYKMRDIVIWLNAGIWNNILPFITSGTEWVNWFLLWCDHDDDDDLKFDDKLEYYDVIKSNVSGMSFEKPVNCKIFHLVLIQ